MTLDLLAALADATTPQWDNELVCAHCRAPWREGEVVVTFGAMPPVHEDCPIDSARQSPEDLGNVARRVASLLPPQRRGTGVR